MLRAAYTLVQNDMVILELWLKYYSKYFDTLLVVGNGTKDQYNGTIEGFKSKYKVRFERTNGFAGNSDLTLGIVTEKQKELLKEHEWVLYSDCDEYVVADPEKYTDLKDFMDKCQDKKTYCECFSPYKEDDEGPIDYSKPYLMQRKYWFKDRSYNKPLLSRVPLNWAPGCHKERDMPDEDSKKIANTGLILVHLKYSDLNPQGRDLGPTITGLNMDIIKEGKAVRMPIPDKIRGLF